MGKSYNLKNIEDIINNQNLNMAEKSDSIMELLRKDYIFLKKTDVEGFGDKKTVTIDPKEILSNPLTNEDDYYRIYGFSFGPFNPEFFFSTGNNYRFIWLLKEPLCESLDDIKYMTSRNEGHNQAKEYALWKDIKTKNDTKNRVVHLTKSILKGIEPENRLWDDESDETFQEVMKHICILEVNHFPGLKFGSIWESNDNFIKKYAEDNKEEIEKMVKFYLSGNLASTKVIIGAFTLKYFFNKGYGDENHYLDHIINGIDKSDVSVFNNLLIDYEVTKLPEKTTNEIYIDDKSNVFIDAYHPTPNKRNKSYIFSDEMARFDGERIRLINSNKEH